MNAPEQHPPSGWYPDPADPTLLRYWDGSAWGDLAPQSPATGYGDYGSWLSETFAVLLPRALSAVVLLFLVPAVVLVALSLSVRAFIADLGFDNVDDEFVGFEGASLALPVAVAAVGLLVSSIGYLSAHIDLYLAHQDRPQALSRSLLAGVRVLPRAVAWLVLLVSIALLAVVLLIGVPVLLAATVGVGFLALLIVTIPVLVGGMVYLGVRLCFAVTCIAVGPHGVNPIGESWRMTERRWGKTFLRLVLLFGIGYFVNSAFQGAMSVFATAAIPDNVEFGDTGDELLVDGVPVEQLQFVDFEVFLPGASVFVLVAIVYALGNAISQAIQISGATALYGRADGESR